MKPHPEYDNLLQFGLLEQEYRIEHFVTTRMGGVSGGAFSSFNMGNFSDDSSLHITENRAILARMMYRAADDFIIPHQTHGTKVAMIDAPFLRMDRNAQAEALYGVDATITAERGIFLSVTTADCVPILLFDRKKSVIAAIHAGWRGTAGRIVEKTVTLMCRQYALSPADIIAGIGPAISPQHYEVGAEVVAQFADNGFDSSDPTLFIRNVSDAPCHLDLKEINRRELLRLGVPDRQIETTDLCTFEREDLFFSARRQTVHSGRMLSAILLKENL